MVHIVINGARQSIRNKDLGDSFASNVIPENLAVVIEADKTEFGEFYAFETLTLCPFDRRALEPGLLNPEERAWLDDYHATVRAALAPLLEEADLAWLERHCAPL